MQSSSIVVAEEHGTIVGVARVKVAGSEHGTDLGVRLSGQEAMHVALSDDVFNGACCQGICFTTTTAVDTVFAGSNQQHNQRDIQTIIPPLSDLNFGSP
ncbi:hypothetical protein ACQR1I_17770 [Bradyrhizobium sp. HKCCYLS2038]|uniref:hypothetical protein n=1 Tax=unclassified Bradyrhizobium TaxID=2631580 RepID=UPI003EBD37A8